MICKAHGRYRTVCVSRFAWRILANIITFLRYKMFVLLCGPCKYRTTNDSTPYYWYSKFSYQLYLNICAIIESIFQITHFVHSIYCCELELGMRTKRSGHLVASVLNMRRGDHERIIFAINQPTNWSTSHIHTSTHTIAIATLRKTIQLIYYATRQQNMLLWNILFCIKKM